MPMGAYRRYLCFTLETLYNVYITLCIEVLFLQERQKVICWMLSTGEADEVSSASFPTSRLHGRPISLQRDCFPGRGPLLNSFVGPIELSPHNLVNWIHVLPNCLLRQRNPRTSKCGAFAERWGPLKYGPPQPLTSLTESVSDWRSYARL